MNDSSMIANGSADPFSLAGLFVGEDAVESGPGALPQNLADKIEAARRHDEQVDRLIESYLDTWPPHGSTAVCH